MRSKNNHEGRQTDFEELLLFRRMPSREYPIAPFDFARPKHTKAGVDVQAYCSTRLLRSLEV
jgi:hypothetical protein